MNPTPVILFIVAAWEKKTVVNALVVLLVNNVAMGKDLLFVLPV